MTQEPYVGRLAYWWAGYWRGGIGTLLGSAVLGAVCAMSAGVFAETDPDRRTVGMVLTYGLVGLVLGPVCGLPVALVCGWQSARVSARLWEADADVEMVRAAFLRRLRIMGILGGLLGLVTAYALSSVPGWRAVATAVPGTLVVAWIVWKWPVRLADGLAARFAGRAVGQEMA